MRALRAEVAKLFGTDCRDDGSDVCAEHSELLFDGRCEDSPQPLKNQVLAAIDRHFPETPTAGSALSLCEERERDLRDALVEASYYHVRHDGTPRHPQTCHECRVLAEGRSFHETPR